MRLEKLSRSTKSDDRKVAAQHPGTPHLILYKLSHDAEQPVRKAVVINKATPRWILKEMLEDADGSIRMYARYRLDNEREVV